jgi:hypothetical protein
MPPSPSVVKKLEWARDQTEGLQCNGLIGSELAFSQWSALILQAANTVFPLGGTWSKLTPRLGCGYDAFRIPGLVAEASRLVWPTPLLEQRLPDSSGTRTVRSVHSFGERLAAHAGGPGASPSRSRSPLRASRPRVQQQPLPRCPNKV